MIKLTKNGWNGNGDVDEPEGLLFICNENIEIQKDGFDIDSSSKSTNTAA